MSVSSTSLDEFPKTDETQGVVLTHRWFLGFIFAYCALVALVAAAYGQRLTLSLGMYTGTFAVMTGTYCIGFLLLYPLRIMIFERPEQLTATIIADLRENYLTRERLLPAALILFIIPVFISAFTPFVLRRSLLAIQVAPRLPREWAGLSVFMVVGGECNNSELTGYSDLLILAPHPDDEDRGSAVGLPVRAYEAARPACTRLGFCIARLDCSGSWRR